MDDRGEHPRSALIRIEEGLRHWILAVLHPEAQEKCEESQRLLRPVTPPSAPPQSRRSGRLARS